MSYLYRDYDPARYNPQPGDPVAGCGRSALPPKPKPHRRGTKASLSERVRYMRERGMDVRAVFDGYGFVSFENAQHRNMSTTTYSAHLTYDAAETWLDGFDASFTYAS